MKSRKGTGVVVAFVGFASLGIVGSAVHSFLPQQANATAEPRINGKPASNKQLDGWIRGALKVMAQEGIPGTYESVHRNIIRESGGNPSICNNTDINARNGVPSCGLLQVIPPTFEAHKLPQSAYDRAGVNADAKDRFDPVANIVTACAYAWSRYPNGLQIKGQQGINGVDGPY